MVLIKQINTVFQYIKSNKSLCIIASVFCVLYALQSIVNHLYFRTFALDLGAYTNALYDYGHFQWHDKGVFKFQDENMLSDHFDLYLILLSPLGYLFGNYTLLIVQIAFVLFGGFGVYQLIEYKFKNRAISVCALLSFYLFFGIYTVFSFDYHSSVLAAMILPIVLLKFYQKQFKWFYIMLFLMWIGKETESIWTFFICMGLLLENRKDKEMVKHSSIAMGLSLVYFLLILKIVMPAFANSGVYENYKFHTLGNNYSEAFQFIFSHPREFIEKMYRNTSGDPQYGNVKIEFYVFFIFSGGLLMFFRPVYILMMAPIFIMKMGYDDPAVWSIGSHYSIEFAPVCAIGAFTFIGSLKYKYLKRFLMGFMVFCTFAVTIRMMDYTLFWMDSNRIRLYQIGHYRTNYDAQKVRYVLSSLPKDAAVAAQSPAVPHVAYRDKCYQLPKVKDAEYIVHLPKEIVTYPIMPEDLNRIVNDSLATNRWEYYHNDSDLVIIKKR
jgi:uncharacterized membrane protein